jgi:hypothetical protein
VLLDLFSRNAWSVPIAGLNYLNESGKFILCGRFHATCFSRYRMLIRNVNVNIKLTRAPEFVCLLGNRYDNKAGINVLNAVLCVAEGELKPLLLAAHSYVFGINRQSYYAMTRT